MMRTHMDSAYINAGAHVPLELGESTVGIYSMEGAIVH